MTDPTTTGTKTTVESTLSFSIERHPVDADVRLSGVGDDLVEVFAVGPGSCERAKLDRLVRGLWNRCYSACWFASTSSPPRSLLPGSDSPFARNSVRAFREDANVVRGTVDIRAYRDRPQIGGQSDLVLDARRRRAPVGRQLVTLAGLGRVICRSRSTQLRVAGHQAGVDRDDAQDVRRESNRDILGVLNTPRLVVMEIRAVHQRPGRNGEPGSSCGMEQTYPAWRCPPERRRSE